MSCEKAHSTAAQRTRRPIRFLVLLCVLAVCSGGVWASGWAKCERTLYADVVALDQPFFWNRLGVVQPQGMIFALKQDVRPFNPGGPLVAGGVKLREDKRPRPMVLRMNVGDCLQIHFTNLLDPVRRDNEQVATRSASVHVIGMQLVGNIQDDGSNVGTNPSSLVAPGQSRKYTLYAEREGQHLLYSTGATTGGEGDGGQLNSGLFGAVNVEPRGATWYRSQVTQFDLQLATRGYTPIGQPLIDYEAVYPNGEKAGIPIFRMLDDSLDIVHTDLTAIIAGPFDDWYPENPVYPDRDLSFREFTILYHDEIGAKQAFEIFEDPVFDHTLHSVRDGFALNYGTGGIGAEILANRLNVGPMRDCTDCKYEEFFLTSWAVGDPAMVVDVPANACVGDPNCRATKALYPDDPSNVYHSYLRDHVKFRIIHGGSKEHHIHHQHTHQWLYAPDSDESAYLDSQALGPGSSFTLEMVYNGSGNRNQAVGDSIFHCHFYPHFAQGMWALWRVHDVFEDGSRRLPDGEITQGTPIPAVVPLPDVGMAPMPGAEVTIAADPRLPKLGGQVRVNGKFVRELTEADVTGNPGYPFWVPGIAGHRPPHPPMDTIDDGGLRRHVLAGGESIHVETRLDFTKQLTKLEAIELAEGGEPIERVAMRFHSKRHYDSFTQQGIPEYFFTNGLDPVPGAPFADPCVDDYGNPVGTTRTYKAADIQLDVIFNKSGWHFPQQRIITLWGDVQDTFDGIRPPQPLFFRANTGDCISYYLTNLVPNVYELDDFQVRTPTDILGQHIHLVKFDVLASDGAANGWNYEDGSFSPFEVRERIQAVRAQNGCDGSTDGTFACPVPKAHPYFGPGPDGKFLGAQTTIQRWYADEVLNLDGQDRTLRTIFTHDHFGPSTHQQAGLYAGLVVEPEGSVWRDPETGVVLGSRFDGGPTSWRADILSKYGEDDYREFLFEFADFALAYQADSHPDIAPGRGPVFPLPWNGVARSPGEGFDNPAKAVNPPGVEEVGLPFLLDRPIMCPGGVMPPCVEAISADDPGTMVVNYRNEPVPLRVRDPNTNMQAAGDQGDLSFVFSSKILRADPDLNVQPGFYPPLTGGVAPTDPFTPLLRAYQGDKIQIRHLVGATEEGHNFSVHGLNWLFEPSWSNSGYVNSQMTGISEHFEVATRILPRKGQNNTFSDYLYQNGSSSDDLWNGMWGILRAYHDVQPDLLPLPNNPTAGPPIGNLYEFDGVCPKWAPVRTFEVAAVTAQQALPWGILVYNPRRANGGPLHDPTAILWVRSSDLDADGKLKPGVPIEPLILRANAGDCIDLIVENRLPENLLDLDGFNTMPMIVDKFNANQVKPSSHVGLHAQLVAYDVSRHDGANVGFNTDQTVAPNSAQKMQYRYYAGILELDPYNDLNATPVEFGATNLISSDPIKHSNKGAIGALIIEPEYATWDEDPDSRASATVRLPNGQSFREFVLLFQDDINLRFGTEVQLPKDEGVFRHFLEWDPVPNLADSEDAEDSAQKAFNYRTEPMWFRKGFSPDANLHFTGGLDLTDVLTNGQVGGDPETPLFTAQKGADVRFRILEPGGHSRNHVFQLHGHVWQQEPFRFQSLVIGNNPLSMWEGARMGIGPTSHFNALLQNGAGGKFKVTGDFLYRDFASFQFDGGLWGIFRVTDKDK